MTAARLIAAAMLMAAVGSGAAHAGGQINHKEAVVVDPAKAYIFYRTKGKLDFRFLREVSDAERAVYDAKRAKAFAKWRTAYERKLASYPKEIAAYRKMSPAERRAAGEEPARPVEHTRETFPYPPPELENFLTVGAGPQFSKDKPEYSYLVAVPPGSYILYGNIAVTDNGVTGVCLCMGSVKFDAAAGKITDLGQIRLPRVEAVLARKDAARPEFQGETTGVTSHALVPASPSLPVPPRLAGLPVVAADLRAAGKLPNYFGVLVDRLTQVPGVLAYRRDEVVDVKSGGAQATASR